MMNWLQGELPGRTITFRSNIANDEMIRDIHVSLNNGNPVVIAFGAANPYNEPHYDFHLSVVYGLNLYNETIMIADAYGTSYETSLVDFLNRMSFTEMRKYPLVHQFILVMTNLQDRNAYFLIN